MDDPGLDLEYHVRFVGVPEPGGTRGELLASGAWSRADGDSLVLEATGEELDRLSANDQLVPYRREFTGPVSGWIGEHTPWDQGSDDVADPEQLGDWRFAFAIESAGVAAG